MKARTVSVTERDIVSVHLRRYFVTTLVFPASEQLVSAAVGAKELWPIDGAANFVTVKCTEAGSETSLSVIMKSGNSYTFALDCADKGTPDIKVFLELADDSPMRLALGSSLVYTAEEYKATLARAREAEDRAALLAATARKREEEVQQKAHEQARKAASDLPKKVNTAYNFKAGVSPFYVSEIYNDGQFTYIKAKPQEVAALYERRDGADNLISWHFENGLYIADKVIEDGYLRVGKKRLDFRLRRDGGAD